YVDQYRPRFVVVHSTVLPGTCDAHGWVYSPVRGRHPRMEEGIRTFVKHFGGEDARRVTQEFAKANITVTIHPRAVDLEVAKLVELAQFGVEVRMMHQVKSICDTYGADFWTVYQDFGRTYNAGYDELGFERFHKPVLDYIPG